MYEFSQTSQCPCTSNEFSQICDFYPQGPYPTDPMEGENKLFHLQFIIISNMVLFCSSIFVVTLRNYLYFKNDFLYKLSKIH